jgi:hypothetical protein
MPTSRSSPLAEPAAFTAHLGPLRQIEWVVYVKRPFGGPQQVLDYLGRYTHRVAIANSRLINIDNAQTRAPIAAEPLNTDYVMMATADRGLITGVQRR